MAPKTLNVVFAADSSQVGKAFAQIEGQTRSFGQKMQGLGVGLTAGLTAPLIGFGAMAVKEASEAKVVMGQTEAVIKSTGGAANVTAQQISGLSERLGKLAGAEDDAIQQGANMLLTFTGVRNEVGAGNDVFDQATKAVTDLAVFMNKGSAEGADFAGKAVMVGKALNDPVAGMTALTKAGVQFTDAQKAQIKALVESGDKLGAQKIILGELQTQFGGAAKAAGENQAPLEKLKVTLAGLAQTVGETILPFVEKFTAKIAEWAQKFQELSPEMQGLILKIGLFAAAIGPLLLIGSKVVAMFQLVGTAFRALSLIFMTNPFILLAAAIIALVALVILNWDTIKNAIGTAWEWIKSTTAAVWEGIKAFLSAAWNFIKAIFMNTNPVGIIIQHWDTIRNATSAVWNAIQSFLSGVWSGIRSTASAVWNGITGAISGAVNTVRSVVVGAWNAVVGAINSARAGIGSAVNSIIGFFANLWAKAQYYVSKIINAIQSLPFVPGSPIPMVVWAEQTLKGMNAAFDQMHAPEMDFGPGSPEGGLTGGLAGAGAGLGSGAVELHSHLYLDGKQIAEVVEIQFHESRRRNGSLSFQT